MTESPILTCKLRPIKRYPRITYPLCSVCLSSVCPFFLSCTAAAAAPPSPPSPPQSAALLGSDPVSRKAPFT